MAADIAGGRARWAISPELGFRSETLFFVGDVRLRGEAKTISQIAQASLDHRIKESDWLGEGSTKTRGRDPDRSLALECSRFRNSYATEGVIRKTALLQCVKEDRHLCVEQDHDFAPRNRYLDPCGPRWAWQPQTESVWGWQEC